jgi:hypothetical protein
LPNHGNNVRAAVGDGFGRVWGCPAGQAGKAFLGLAGALMATGGAAKPNDLRTT